MTQTVVRVDTAGIVFLHYHDRHPMFFVSLKPDLCSYCSAVSVLMPPPRWWDYDLLHSWLHLHLRNTCQGKTNHKARRNGNDSEYSALVRDGNGKGGCFDTPLMDIDSSLLWGRDLVGVIEVKRPGERFDDSQREVLRNLRDLGLEVHLFREKA